MQTITWSEFVTIINQPESTIHYLPIVKTSQDVSRIAVSLANDHGGSIVLGYDKYNVQLHGAECDHVWLEAVLLNDCKPGIMHAIKGVIKNNRKVYIVDIPEGKQKPYQVFGESFLMQDNKPVVSEVAPATLMQSTQESRQEKALQYVRDHKEITNAKYRELNMVSHKTAHVELTDLMDRGLLMQVGQGRSTKYVLNDGSYIAPVIDKGDDYELKAVMPDRALAKAQAESLIKKATSAPAMENLFGSTIDTMLESEQKNRTALRLGQGENTMNDHVTINEPGQEDSTEGVDDFPFCVD